MHIVAFNRDLDSLVSWTHNLDSTCEDIQNAYIYKSTCELETWIFLSQEYWWVSIIWKAPFFFFVLHHTTIRVWFCSYILCWNLFEIYEHTLLWLVCTPRTNEFYGSQTSCVYNFFNSPYTWDCKHCKLFIQNLTIITVR